MGRTFFSSELERLLRCLLGWNVVVEKSEANLISFPPLWGWLFLPACLKKSFVIAYLFPSFESRAVYVKKDQMEATLHN